MDLHISGLDERIAALGRAPAQIDAGVLAAIRAAADEASATLAAATPVRTGTAGRGWRTEPMPGGAAVVNDVPYVPFVIEGTGRRRFEVVNPNWPGMVPNPALRGAWLRAPDDIAATVAAGVARVVADTVK